jgi:hypothetical protein
VSDAVLERFGSATGQERVDVRRVESEGTVSLRREHTRVPGALGMVGWLAGATRPAEYEASEHIAVSVGARVVIDAEAAIGIAAAFGRMVSHARVLPTLSLATEAGGYPATLDVADGNGPRPIQSSTTAAAQADERAAMRALAFRVAAEAPAVEVELPEVPPLVGNPIEDARRLFGLTVAQLAPLLGVTERQVYRFDPATMPEVHRERLNALVALGLLLVGGLGPKGARQWLDAGEPTGAELLREGHYRTLRDRAEELLDSVAT